MNPFTDVKNGTLFRLDSSLLMPIRYTTDSANTATFIFSEELPENFPRQVFLMPDGEEYDYSTWLYTLSGETRTFQEEPEDTDDADDTKEPVTWYLMDASTKEMVDSRNDLRVSLSFDIDAQFSTKPVSATVTVKDMSAGGFMFVSEEAWEAGTTLSYIFSAGKTPAYVAAVIKKIRPTRFENLKGYGCQFINLTPSAEAAVRNFVFQEEVLQRRRRLY